MLLRKKAGKFQSDVTWNVAALGIAGACGIGLNVLIASLHGEAVLGVFNQVFAAYIFFSQVAVLGVHLSVLTHVGQSGDIAESRHIVSAAAVLTFAIGCVVSLCFWAAAKPLGAVLDSPDVARGMVYAAPGLLFFALSKVVLGAVNGLRRMRWYACLTAGRFVFMIGFFGLLTGRGVDTAALPLILSAAEFVTLLLAIVAASDLLSWPNAETRRLWFGRHLHFGARGFLGGVVLELNTRVDVLMLGVFTSDSIVGLYSFAAILAEGMYQILIVLRQNYSPILARLWKSGDRDAITRTVRKGCVRTYAVAALGAALAVLAYMLLVPLVTGRADLQGSWVLFAILVGGMALGAGYVPFNHMLVVAGRPGANTWMVASVLGFNAIGNLVLIAQWGAIGAAVATGISFVFAALVLKITVKRVLDITF